MSRMTWFVLPGLVFEAARFASLHSGGNKLLVTVAAVVSVEASAAIVRPWLDAGPPVPGSRLIPAIVVATAVRFLGWLAPSFGRRPMSLGESTLLLPLGRAMHALFASICVIAGAWAARRFAS